MRVFLLCVCAALSLASSASSQPSGTSTLSYSQLLRESARLQQTVIDAQESRKLSYDELMTLWREAERLRLIFETSFGEASSSLETSQQELTAIRQAFAAVSESRSQLQKLLNDSKRQAFWRGLRNTVLAFLGGLALGALAL